MIRSFEPGDAELVAGLLSALLPASVQTAGSLRHRHMAEPPRARRGSWVALEGDELAGFATAWFDWFDGAAGGIPPGDPENRVTLDEWRAFILDNPLLDDAGSFVLLDADDRIASLAWLLVDHAQRRAENEWTATLPQLRGRGLARLAKLTAIRWAAEHDIAEIRTGNDPDNLPMRELNRQLGYRELFMRRDLERLA